ncbi:MAG: type II toxin-antitoxin system RelE/ParE family toxin [Planctomycetota bacterium]
MEVIVWKAAKLDMFEAGNWLEEQQAGQGRKFIQEVESTFLRISLFPFASILHARGFRTIVVTKYKYLILFRVKKKRIEVFAVIHGARDRSSWEHRVPK